MYLKIVAIFLLGIGILFMIVSIFLFKKYSIYSLFLEYRHYPKKKIFPQNKIENHTTEITDILDESFVMIDDILLIHTNETIE